MKVTFEEIAKIAAMNLKCDEKQINLKSGLGHHYNWDSLAHVTLMLSLEEKFGVTIDETNIATLNTIEQILAFLNKELQ